MASTNKPCPFCSESILPNAIKCKHCGSMLVDAPRSVINSEEQIRRALAQRFEILEEIGRGGMSTVYKAIQKNLKRTVALKVLPQEFTEDEEFLARFHREAQAAAALSHPNLITVFDEGYVEGIHFIAMEFIAGTTLARLVQKRGPVSSAELQGWIIPLAEGLAYAHDQGVIHRDIKSSNIILDQKDRAVLTDFGLARASQGTHLTHAGIVLGTPEYMSPEQAKGEIIDKRSDIYSLGIVMYECLVGRVPFRSDTVLGTIYKIVDNPPTPPRNLRSDIPKEMQNVVLRCLAKQPDDRYQDCTELVKALQSDESPHTPTIVRRQPEEHEARASEADMSTWITLKWQHFVIGVILLLTVTALPFLPPSTTKLKNLILSQLSALGSSTEAEEIESLLAQAKRYFAQNEFTTPAGANAYETLQRVLLLDPNNLEAKSLIKQIEDSYLAWGETQMRNGNFEKAIYYYNKALTVGQDTLAKAQLTVAQKRLDERKIEKFVGTWTKEMPGATVRDGIEIVASPELKVTMRGGWMVWGERFESGVLSFKARRGKMDQQFDYRLEVLSRDRLELRILNSQDGTVLAGVLTR